jgi:hypothetical protein
MSRCYPNDGKLMLHLQALKLCVVALGLMQRIPRAEPQSKFANTHSLELHIGVGFTPSARQEVKRQLS